MDNYDASVDGTYNTSPIPGGLNIVEGLGNSIDNVTIPGGGGDRTNSVGLFSYVHAVFNLRVHHIDIKISNRFSDYVGGLAGTAGVLSGDEVTGSVRGSAYVSGGLVGVMGGNRKNRVVACSTHVRVEGYIAGGLVGDD